MSYRKEPCPVCGTERVVYDHQEYPKQVHGRVVHGAEEEKSVRDELEPKAEPLSPEPEQQSIEHQG